MRFVAACWSKYGVVEKERGRLCAVVVTAGCTARCVGIGSDPASGAALSAAGVTFSPRSPRSPKDMLRKAWRNSLADGSDGCGEIMKSVPLTWTAAERKVAVWTELDTHVRRDLLVDELNGCCDSIVGGLCMLGGGDEREV